MKKGDLWSIFQSNNSKLEAVLNKKKLSGNVKNLLLNMLYNITSSYNDYANIKVNVEDKNKFVENIINIIKSCDKIETISPSSEEGLIFTKQGITCKVDTYLKNIKVFPTEKAMLYALFKVNDTQMYLDEKYHLLRISMQEMLNEGRDINNIEIIRDFNSWSWNTLQSEISNIDCNLIYQNLQILLGFEVLDNWMKSEKQKDLLEKLEEELKKRYDENEVKTLVEYICRLSILVCIQRNKVEGQRLLEEREWDKKELTRLKNKGALVEELTKTKKLKAREIKRIDKILNNDEMLIKEFEKRNKKLSEYKKIFSVENLEGTLKKERKKALNEIEECNKLLDAKIYVGRVKELERNLDLLKDLKIPKNKQKYKIDIQKIFIKCLEQRIDSINTPEQKREAINLFKIIRYYNFIVYDEERFVKDVEELKEEIQEIQGKILLKLYDLKAINHITKDLETDIGIINPIFDTRIMNLENVYIYSQNQNNVIEVSIYDGNTLELEFTIDNLNNIEIKTKKKIKLFAK